MGKGSKRKLEEREREKVSNNRKAKSTTPRRPNNPTVNGMIKEAIKTLSRKAGASRVAIQSFIENTYDVDENRIQANIRRNLLNMLANNEIVHSKAGMVGANGSFKLTKNGTSDSSSTSPRKRTFSGDEEQPKTPSKKSVSQKSKTDSKTVSRKSKDGGNSAPKGRHKK